MDFLNIHNRFAKYVVDLFHVCPTISINMSVTEVNPESWTQLNGSQ